MTRVPQGSTVRDLKIISPLILAVVLVVLIALLRALVAPVVLIVTVILSFFAALGPPCRRTGLARSEQHIGERARWPAAVRHPL
jgi:hypothetical protein